MTTYYVDYVNGNDANNGLGPDASAGTNKPWKTMAKVLGASGIASGDTVYLSPSGPFRERVTIAMTSPTGETSILGDPCNVQGFKTSGGVMVQPGPVTWTAFETNDTTAPSANGATLDMAGRDYLTFRFITFISGKNTTDPCVLGTTTTSTNCKFLDCCFWAHPASTNAMIEWTWAAAAVTLSICRCTFFQPRTSFNVGAIKLTGTLHASTDYDSVVRIDNNLFMIGMSSGTGPAIYFATTGAGSGKPYGVAVNKNTFLGGSTSFQTGGSVATSTACQFYGNLVYAQTGVSAGSAGQITEDYNYLMSVTRDTNVTDGSSSTQNTHSIVFELGQSIGVGLPLQQFGRPIPSSAGNANHHLQYGGNMASDYDRAGDRFDNWNALDSMGSRGCEGMAQQAQYQTGTVQASTGALQMNKKGVHCIRIPVDTVSTTISIYGRFDASYSTSYKPQARLRPNPLIGFAGETKTMTVASGNWEQLTFSAFTPTAKGEVVLELVNRDATSSRTAAGLVFWDTLAVS